MKVIFRGTRGSTPLVASSVTGTFRSYHSPCVELQTPQNQESIILDAGSGLGPSLMDSFQHGRKNFSILLTHFHWDHILGFLSFYELFYQGVKLKIYSAHEQARDYISVLFQEAYCPLDKKLVLDSFEFVHVKKAIEVGGFKAEFYEVPHSGKTFGIQIEQGGKSLLYTPDVDLAQLKDIPFKLAPQLLICDSFHLLADKKVRGSWGHSSAVEAVQFAQKIKAEKLALFHYAPTYRDSEINRLQEEAKSAIEGPLQLHVSQDDDRIVL